MERYEMRGLYLVPLQAQQLTLFSGMGKMLSARHHTMLFMKTGAICAIKENVECWNKMEHSLAARPGKASWTILADWVVNSLEDSCGLKAEKICSHAWKNYWYIKKKIEKEGNPFYFPKFHEKSQNKYEDISTASGEIFNTFLDYPG